VGFRYPQFTIRKVARRSLRFRLDLSQLALHAAKIRNQLTDRQRISANSQAVDGINIDLSRRPGDPRLA
jgi:hypothetical protein